MWSSDDFWVPHSLSELSYAQLPSKRIPMAANSSTRKWGLFFITPHLYAKNRVQGKINLWELTIWCGEELKLTLVKLSKFQKKESGLTFFLGHSRHKVIANKRHVVVTCWMRNVTMHFDFKFSSKDCNLVRFQNHKFSNYRLCSS